MEKTIKVGSQTYSGKTIKAATQQAIDHLAIILTEGESVNWEPAIVQAPAGPDVSLGVVFKGSDGQWHYRLTWADGSHGSTHSSYTTRVQGEIACRRHVAQLAYSPTFDGTEIVHPDDKEGLEDHARWIKFQRSYATGRAAGLSADDAHKQACGFWPWNPPNPPKRYQSFGQKALRHFRPDWAHVWRAPAKSTRPCVTCMLPSKSISYASI